MAAKDFLDDCVIGPQRIRQGIGLFRTRAVAGLLNGALVRVLRVQIIATIVDGSSLVVKMIHLIGG